METADIAELRAVAARVPALQDVPFDAWQVTPLASLTNRSFRLRAADYDRDVVVRLPGAGTERYLARADEMHNASAASAIGLAPPVLYGDAASGILVTRFIADARTASAGDLRVPGRLAAVAQLLRRLHESGADFRGAIEPFAAIDRYLALAGEPRIARLRHEAESARSALAALPASARPCHGDPVAANWLISDSGTLRLVDWEFSALADPIWDLAVVAIDCGLDRAEEDALLLVHNGRTDDAARRKLDLLKPLIRLVGAAWANAALAAGNRAPGLKAGLERDLAALEDAWLASPNRIV